ncbi:respiratory nitrate reductase 1 subunit beta [Escherichia coli]|nr:respiratory nitrate reductase 1 subunit beta [Escherichia coli]
MKIRSQVGMVLNLDKCIGCHTCSVTCKNVWTSREGVDMRGSTTWKPSRARASRLTGKTRKKYKGGWIRKINGKLQPRMGNRAMLLGKIFANPHLPGIDDITSRSILTIRTCIPRRKAANRSRLPVRVR